MLRFVGSEGINGVTRQKIQRIATRAAGCSAILPPSLIVSERTVHRAIDEARTPASKRSEAL
jgi:hypothetical protein